MSDDKFATMRTKINLTGSSDSPPCLVFIRGGTPGKVIELELSAPYLVGRSPDCQLQIDDPTVSMKHAVIVEQQGTYFIKDQDSTNGTMIGESVITASTKLNGGELIRFGDVLVKFLLHGSAEHDYHNQLLDSIYQDSLTQVNNRRFFDENIKDILQLHEQTNSILSLIIFDIDHFKKVNDDFGHSVGDKVLRQTCKVLQHLLRQEDILLRYGGEEFVIIMPNTDPKYAAEIANRLLAVCRCFDFQKTSRGPKKVTLSAGISSVDYATTKYQDSQIDELFRVADAALYRAKSQGRDRLVSDYST